MGRALRGAIGAAGLMLILLGAPVAAADPVADPVVDAAGATADPAATAAVLPDGVPHLPSPNNLPPGTTQDAPEHPTGSYLRDIWHALRNHDVSMSDALLLIAQRPMSATAPAGMSPRPEQPVPADAPSLEAAPAADPAPEPTP